MTKLCVFFLLFVSSYACLAKDVQESVEKDGVFSGRISSINKKSSLVRIKVSFSNVKYLNKRDKVEFWDQKNKSKRCKAYVAGRSPEYLLVKVPNFEYCFTNLFLIVGAYLKFQSEDLKNNILMGRSLVNILLKKRIALNGKIKKNQISLDSYVEKVDAVSLRYHLLQQKLNNEWKKELANLEEDRLAVYHNFKGLQIRLGDVDHKLEKYKVEDENLKIDRWSLDSRLYYKK